MSKYNTNTSNTMKQTIYPSAIPHHWRIIHPIFLLAGLFVFCDQQQLHAKAFCVGDNTATLLSKQITIKGPHRSALLTQRKSSHFGMKTDCDNSNYDSKIIQKPTSSSTSTIYKDDCFGFITFIGGIAVQDFTFTGIFASLSLLADVLVRLGFLPPDSKRLDIVDRKVPGVIAILTLLLNNFFGLTLAASGSSSISSTTTDDNLAWKVQLAICSFSIVTAFFDIRWRDRFDYPEDF
mmetsp:Transcript_5454/g.11960  ORF Transcript_5454/g.11960 Transcript_5454/m.11960 type:complete len:236 (-) Transcript_5454:56-763(-)